MGPESTTPANEEVLKSFVDEYYTQHIDGIYYAHQPIYGYRTPYAETAQIARYIITRSILDNLARYRFENLIDISGAEGYTAFLIRELLGVKVQTTDWSSSVCAMAKRIYGLDAQVANIKELPFADNQFEVVVCSETLEHIPDWEKGFEELYRITDKLLLITVPHDPIAFVEYNRQHVLGGHINHFTTETFDFLKARDCKFYMEKTLSPFLLKPRVIVEAYPKEGNSLAYRVHNALVPLYRKLFGIKTAQRLISLDATLTRLTGHYKGITLVIEKRPIDRNPNYKPVLASDFMSLTVPHVRIA